MDNVVDIQHEVAIGLFENGQCEIGFAHRGISGRIVGNVLESNALLENVLDPADATGNILDRFFCKWNRHQVV